MFLKKLFELLFVQYEGKEQILVACLPIVNEKLLRSLEVFNEQFLKAWMDSIDKMLLVLDRMLVAK